MANLDAVPPELRRGFAVDESGCWLWSSVDKNTGYGRHRAVYEATNGPVPAGLQLDHLCRNRACVNPDHLEPVTCRENLLRSPITLASINAAKTHCPQGHEYAGTNLAVRDGRRHCKKCDVAKQIRYQNRKKARSA